jgi:hypothetical protein
MGFTREWSLQKQAYMMFSLRDGISAISARLFIHKVQEAMKYSQDKPIDGDVHLDEFVVGRKETGKQGRSYSSRKKKSICAVQPTDQGKLKRFCSLKTDDSSAESL